MKSLKFQTRLIIGFSIILFFSFTIGITSFVLVKNIGNSTEAIYKHPFTVSNSVKDINIGINAIHRSMKDVVLANDTEQLHQSINLVNQYDKEIKNAFSLVSERFLGDKKIVKDTYKTYTKWKIIRNEVIYLKSNGNDIEAANITRDKGAVHVNLLFQKTKILTDFAQSKADEFRLESLKHSKNSRFILLLIISIILPLSTISAFIISKSISQPIHEFIQDLRMLYQKEGISENNIHDKSEQEILTETIFELKQAYGELKDFNTELDNKIDIRTRELKVAKEKAEESEQLKSAFLANMSHEIRTPLNSILGFSEFLKKEDIPKLKKDLYLNLIQSGGQRLLTIISDIVDISKIDAGQFNLCYETCQLNKLIDDLFNQFSITNTNNRVSFSTSKFFSDKDSYISTDTTRLSQVLSNLIENAQKFTRKGEIELRYELTNNQLLFQVKDTGIGIKKEYHEHIFARFRQNEHDKSIVQSGTGLGLSIAKGIVDLFGGKIGVHSEINQGATFFFTIPYLPETMAGLKEPEENNDLLLQRAGKTILVAEDEPSNFIYISDLLHRYNFNVLHAKNGQEAVDIINKKTNVDLILMDIKMPVMNGLIATQEIRKINKTIPVIAQTAYAMADDKRRAMEAGCNDYLSKPISSKMFSQIIHKHLTETYHN